jgi:hypothetical protein
MRFMVVVAEIIGNLSAPPGFMDPGIVDVGSPIHLAIWEILMAVVRSLHCFNRLSIVAAQAVAWATGGRVTLPA